MSPNTYASRPLCFPVRVRVRIRVRVKVRVRFRFRVTHWDTSVPGNIGVKVHMCPGTRTQDTQVHRYIRDT